MRASRFVCVVDAFHEADLTLDVAMSLRSRGGARARGAHAYLPPFFAEAEEHSLATVGWRKYVGARGWGFEIDGLAMRGDDHHEAAFAVDVVKDLAQPDSGTVPYLTMPGLHRRRQQPWVDDDQRGAGVGLGRSP